MTLPKKIRRVVIDVHHEDGSSAHYTINEHVDFKTNFDAPEYRPHSDMSLRPQPGGTTIFTISGVEQYNLTYFPTDEEKSAVPAMARPFGSTPVSAVPEGWGVGDLVRIPARFNKPGTPHAKQSNVWKVTEIVRHKHGGHTYTVELRDGSASKTFMHNSVVYRSSAKVKHWPLRKGDFAISNYTGKLYKVTGPAKVGDMSRYAEGGPEVTIALSAEDGPAVWLIDEYGNQGWTPESSLRPVEVEVKKSQTWKVKS